MSRGYTVRTPERVAEATRLRNQGLMFREIADRMGVSVNAANEWVNDPDGARRAMRKAGYAGRCVDCGRRRSGRYRGDSSPLPDGHVARRSGRAPGSQRDDGCLPTRQGRRATPSRSQAMTGHPRTIQSMPLSELQIKQRLCEIDNSMRQSAHEYAEAAATRTAATRDRELKIAEAFRRMEGTPTERRQLAIAEVGEFGKDAEVTYARLAAEMEVLHDRAMIGASLLKSAKAEDRERRYAEGP
jgi:hypothetical protein